MQNFNAFLSQFNTLSADELDICANKILQIIKQSQDAPQPCDDDNVCNCRRCSSDRIYKYGKDKNGKQRYKCKDCGTLFVHDSFSVVSYTRKDYGVWEKFIKLTLQQASLEVCAKECEICVRTAFVWRHKILDALSHEQDNRVLSGVIEIDEMYIPISYKGNHKFSKKFKMPREPHKRGSTDGAYPLSSKACVMCGYERNGQSYAEVLGAGQTTLKMISHAFDYRLVPDSLLLSDKSSCIKKYFESRTGISHIQMQAHINPKDVHSPPEIKGAFHIQNINNIHSRIRRFLRPYNGVSTKYLNHYISLFIWIENCKKIASATLEEQTSEMINTRNTYISEKELADFPPIPFAA